MTNPFEADTEAAERETEFNTASPKQATDAGVEVETETADVDVDTPELDEAEETDEVPAEVTTGEDKPKAKKEKAPARPAMEEGYISPVQFAKELTKHLEAKGASNKKGLINASNPIQPQQIYSTINSTKNGKNPFPATTVGARNNCIKLSEGLAWWDEKDSRVAASAATAAEKAAKKAAKGSEAGQVETGDTAPVIEDEATHEDAE